MLALTDLSLRASLHFAPSHRIAPFRKTVYFMHLRISFSDNPLLTPLRFPRTCERLPRLQFCLRHFRPNPNDAFLQYSRKSNNSKSSRSLTQRSNPANNSSSTYRSSSTHPSSRTLRILSSSVARMVSFRVSRDRRRAVLRSPLCSP